MIDLCAFDRTATLVALSRRLSVLPETIDPTLGDKTTFSKRGKTKHVNRPGGETGVKNAISRYVFPPGARFPFFIPGA